MNKSKRIVTLPAREEQLIDEPDFRLLAEYVLDTICLVGSDLVMSYASPSCERMLGWTPEEMVGKGPDAFVHPDDQPVVAAAHRKLVEHGVDRSPTVVRMRMKSGGYAWVEVNARVIPDPAGSPDYSVVLVMRDISFRKEGAAGPGGPGQDSTATPDTTGSVITGIDLYITCSGHVAFLQSASRTDGGKVVFHGYVTGPVNGKSSRLDLQWLPTGECISDGEERHRIKSKA